MTPQMPIASPFGYRSTALEVIAGIDLSGKGGVYTQNCNIATPWEDGQPPYIGVHPHVRDTAVGDALWAASEEMTGVRFVG